MQNTKHTQTDSYFSLLIRDSEEPEDVIDSLSLGGMKMTTIVKLKSRETTAAEEAYKK